MAVQMDVGILTVGGGELNGVTEPSGKVGENDWEVSSWTRRP